MRLLVRRDLQQRVSGTVLGVSWLLLQAAFLLGIYTFVFGAVLRVRFTEGGGTSDFALYLMAAMLPFLGFQEGVQRASSVLQENRDLISKVVYPPLLLPLSVVASSLAVEVSGLLVLILVLMWKGLATVALLTLPLLILVRILLTLGVAWVVSILTVFLRDLSQLLTMLLTLLLFATPILYPLSAVPERYQGILLVNPFTLLVTTYRGVLIEGVMPSGAFYLLAILALVFAVLCLLFFDRMIERARDFL
jgi:lipopolysaccharide transport system permease protein